MELLKNILLISGSLILLLSLQPLRRLIRQLPQNGIRPLWTMLVTLVGLFFVGYLAYTLIFWSHYRGPIDLIVPLIFFFGAIFVWLVGLLSLRTAGDLKRMYVLEHESTTDSLMGIYNRRFLERRLHEEFFRSARYRYPLSVIMIDIDHFKQVNDEWGHQVGDLVLKRLAEMIVGNVRETDVASRYGGEELFLILPHTGLEDAMFLAEKLRRMIETTEIAPDEARQRTVKVTASMGVAALTEHTESAHHLLGQADKALYFAKQRGRNRSVCCADLGSADRC